MSDLSTEQFLDLLQRQGGPRHLDLAGRDLSEIDLSGEALEEVLEELGYTREEIQRLRQEKAIV